MNLELLDPWEQEYPQVIEETLEDGYILHSKFNRRGTLLAAGCLDGRCVVWDFDTKGVARNLTGHVKPVASISWSRNGRYLLSASKDWTCILWDLITGAKHTKIRFDTPLMMAQMHPKKNFRFVAALFQEKPVILDLSNGSAQKIALPTGEENENTTSYVTFATWNKTGHRIYTGSSKGYVNIIDAESLKIIHSMRVASTTIKSIQWSRNGRDILINANDRIIRYYRLEDLDGIPTFQVKFQDLVNRVQWSQACFSADGEFVIAGSAHKAEHNIYIWDKNIGNLVKILEGPKEPLDDLAWHPVRPIIASVSSYGNIYIWTAKHEENWSAFAPDFTELEENLEYEEQEDEFDVVSEETVSKRKNDDEDIVVDVTTCDKIQAFLDLDDEEGGEEEVFYLPSLPYDDADVFPAKDEGDGSTSSKKRMKKAHKGSFSPAS
ncbi:WD40-repeat-containing domain protein [Radiomyces spectabilis]|uniref:WD40-repeat-containing domain protein n=1 Tax=Radiomyces spectabilis TaxID=64574 RepID=UPI00221E6251|nr:WD40-repeat-containing domain protein [Radiomyces spectabilis]KAI8371652.1 WD40-repeat-containing domain protein [Radiomyces spectabilis]